MPRLSSDTAHLEPTPNYDCHICRNTTSSSVTDFTTLLRNTQVLVVNDCRINGLNCRNWNLYNQFYSNVFIIYEMSSAQLGLSTTLFQTSRYCRAKVEFNPINLVGHSSNSRGWTLNRGLNADIGNDLIVAQLVFLFFSLTIFQETSPEIDVKNCQCYSKKQIFHGLYSYLP